MRPPLIAAASLLPSAEEAIETKSPPTLFENHVEPELVERKMVAPPQTAASPVPSAEDESDTQFILGTLFVFHVAP